MLAFSVNALAFDYISEKGVNVDFCIHIFIYDNNKVSADTKGTFVLQVIAQIEPLKFVCDQYLQKFKKVL